MVPTTILAEQHYRTFCRRFNDFPVRVEVLNRFKSTAEQKNCGRTERSKSGYRHGISSPAPEDIAFKDLGLVIIDEEQRFGVSHKNKKKSRTDSLMCSRFRQHRSRALFIYRLSAFGICPALNTPPEDRVSIKTYVLEFDEDAIKSAVEKELARLGQFLFFIPALHSIYSVCPSGASLRCRRQSAGTVHGQMKPAEIEKSNG